MEFDVILRKHFAPYVLALLQQGAIIADTSDDEGAIIVPPNDKDQNTENPEGQESTFKLVEQSEKIDPEVKEGTQWLLKHLKKRATLEGKVHLETLNPSLTSLLTDYKKTLEKNQELEEENKSLKNYTFKLEDEIQELKDKYNAGEVNKENSDKFAVKMLSHVLNAHKEGIKSEAKITKYFNDLGLKSARGKKFNPSSIHYILKRQKELGLFDTEENNDSPYVA